MDRFQTLRTFIAVADHASFAQAARTLSMSPTTVTRAVAALERSLSVALLVRTTRRVRLTEEGAAFLERSRAGLAEIDQAFEAARGNTSTPRGTLTVTAPVMFGRLHIMPIVAELIARHAYLDVRLLLLDRVVNLVDEGVDVAVRIAELPDSALHQRRIATVRRVLTASSAYLAGAGAPSTRAELRRHRLILIEDERGRAAPPHDAGGARLSVNNMDAAIDAAAAGLGIVNTLSYQVARHLAAGTLVRVLADEPAPALPVSLLFQGRRAANPNIRAFVDLAGARLGGGAL